MSIENGIIKAPISIKDSYNVLNVSPLILPDGSTNFDLGYICGNEHGQINLYSAHKPIDVNDIAELSGTSFMLSEYGLSFKIINNITDIPKNYDGNLNGISYIKPRTDYFKRLTDFIDYNHNASNFIKTFISSESVQSNIDSSALFDITYENKAGNVFIKNILTLRDKYFGVLLHHANTSSFRYGTSNAIISNDGLRATIGIYGLPTGVTYDAYFLLCDKPFVNLPPGTNTPPANNNFILLPGKSKLEFYIMTSNPNVSLRVELSGDQINCFVSFSNPSSSPYTFKNNFIRMRNDNPPNPNRPEEQKEIIDDFTIPASGVSNKFYAFNPWWTEAASYEIFLSLNGGNITRSDYVYKNE